MGIFSNKFDEEIVTHLTANQTEMLAFIYSLLPGDSSVKDILQRVNLVIWKKRSNFKKETNFRAWMFSIVRWEVRSYLKECKRSSWLIIDDELTQRITESMGEKTKAGSMDSMRAALDLCIEKLNDTEKELITHRYFKDEHLQTYADSHDRSVSSIKVSLFRIRTKLRNCIKAHHLIKNTLDT